MEKERSQEKRGEERHMDVKELQKIVTLMNENDLVEIEIEEQGTRLRLKKAEHHMHAVAHAVHAAPPPPHHAPAVAAAPAVPAAAAAPEGEAGMHTIAAPMVGTFYSAPSPDAEPYARVGSRISPDSVVCILEAMKVMNEIKAECQGEIIKVCVKNGEAVEYGQALFLVRPA